MKSQHQSSRDRSALILAVVLAGGVAGCGGGAPPVPTATETSSAKAPASAAVSGKRTSRGRGQPLAPGGDLGVRERRHQKLQERAAAGDKS